MFHPAFDATTTTDYSFTPDPGQCATTPAPVQVVVNPIITTTFDPIDPICEGDPNPLPTTDVNGVTGTWSPAFDPTTTTDYTVQIRSDNRRFSRHRRHHLQLLELAFSLLFAFF